MSSFRRVHGILLCLVVVVLAIQLFTVRRDFTAWANDSWQDTAEVISFLTAPDRMNVSPSLVETEKKEPKRRMMRKRLHRRRENKKRPDILARQQAARNTTIIPHYGRPFASHSYKFSGPVFILSLPKSGTTSLSKFLKCGGLKAPHTYGHRESDGKNFRLGTCMEENFVTDRPLLTNCRPDFYHAYSDIGTVSKRTGCFYPSIQALDRIARDYPTATLIVSYRSGWYDAAQKWNHGTLVKRWTSHCGVFPNSTDAEEWQEFYERHRRRIRQTVESFPTLSYLEFNLTDPMAGQKLSDFTGIDASCWRDCKPNGPCRKEQPSITASLT